MLNYQSRIRQWIEVCFGHAVGANKAERSHRFIEEALELVQACGCTITQALQIVDYVYSRPQGNAYQEVGGVMVTLAALCNANGIDMDGAALNELGRVWENIDKIRDKQAAKLKSLPLSGATAEYPLTWWTATEEHGESLWNESDTREEAIAAARNDEHGWIVQARRQDFDLTIVGDRILENLCMSNQDMTNEDGDFLNEVTTEQTDDLGNMLTEMIKAWAAKHQISTRAWALADIGKWEKVSGENS